MKFLGFTFKTKKELKEEIESLNQTIDALRATTQEYARQLNRFQNDLEEMYNNFPFNVGDVVYTVELRNASGRYTSKHPSRAHSSVVEA